MSRCGLLKDLWGLGRAALVGCALVVSPPLDARAQSPRAASALHVSVTVVKSCTIDVSALLSGPASSLDESTAASWQAYELRCGNDFVVFPRVSKSADGRRMVIEY